MVKIVDAGLQFRNILELPPKNIRKLVQHHMAHKSWNIYQVHNFHRDSNGWNGIGYNYWVAFDGTIYKGRGLHYAAGVGGHNHYTLHIGYQGDFSKQNMTDAQVKSGAEINKWLMGLYNLSANDIIGHNDLASTACPGVNFRMKELRELSSGVGGIIPTTVKSASVAKPTVKWTKVTGKWTGQTLGNGEYGEPVKQLQTMLANNTPPFYPNKGAKNDGIDSYYGDDTEDAVRRFQSYYGLTVDGLAGKEVFNKLNSKTSAASTNKTPSKSLPNAVYRANRPYPNGKDVRAIQEALASIFFYPDKGAKNNGIDGYYGPKTADAVRRFQLVHGLVADGIYGPATRKALEKAMK